VTTVRLDDAAIRALGESADVQNALESVGRQVADRARAAAPKATGAGAASISHEVATDSDGTHVRVSWDNDHFYLIFSELGTSKMPARPFLRPALDGTYEP
jgi:HK97 gp10 family phage protein